MPWLRGVTVNRAGLDDTDWPWSVPAFNAIDELDLAGSVTFLAGENGTGKSTVLEALAVACGCPEQGGPSNPNLRGPRPSPTTYGRIQAVLDGLPVGGAWFLRAETFFDLATTAGDSAFADRPQFRDAQLLADFGRSPHTFSHGQAFLRLFESRMGAQSLWFMDEPEAPLSFQSQLALLGMVDVLAKRGSQFVIATHSPVLLALPGAAIYEFVPGGVHQSRWDDLDLVNDVRAFLTAPDRFFRHLLEG